MLVLVAHVASPNYQLSCVVNLTSLTGMAHHDRSRLSKVTIVAQKLCLYAKNARSCKKIKNCKDIALQKIAIFWWEYLCVMHL